MQEEWIDLRDKIPEYASNLMRVQIQIPCYFDCANDGSALTAWIPENGESCDAGWLYPLPIDLTNKNRNWKWKLNESDKKHYEDLYAWYERGSRHKKLIPLEKYHYYRKRKNEFKTFGQERPMNGSSIILQFEVDGRISHFTNGELWFMSHGMHFMCAEMPKPIKIDLNHTNVVWKWKD